MQNLKTLVPPALETRKYLVHPATKRCSGKTYGRLSNYPRSSTTRGCSVYRRLYRPSPFVPTIRSQVTAPPASLSLTHTHTHTHTLNYALCTCAIGALSCWPYHVHVPVSSPVSYRVWHGVLRMITAIVPCAAWCIARFASRDRSDLSIPSSACASTDPRAPTVTNDVTKGCV